MIFNLVEDVVTAEHGEDVWDDLLEDAGVDGAYTTVGSYPDDDLIAIVDAAGRATGERPDDVLRHVGRRATLLLAQRFPEYFALHTGLRTFLPTLNSVIHPEVRKLYPGANPPHFGFSEDIDGAMLMEYHSDRSMCPLAEGLTLGAADHFGQNVTVTQVRCARTGAVHCLFRIAVE